MKRSLRIRGTGRVFAVVCVAAVLAAACGGTEEGTEYSLNEYLSSFSSDFEPADTRGELADRSEFVVMATLVGVRDGRVAGNDEFASRYLWLEFESEDLDQKVYVEVTRPADADVEYLAEQMPIGSASVIYIRRIAVPPQAERSLWTDDLESDQKFWFTTPQGWILESSAGSDPWMPLTGIGLDVTESSSDLCEWLPPTGVKGSI